MNLNGRDLETEILQKEGKIKKKNPYKATMKGSLEECLRCKKWYWQEPESRHTTKDGDTIIMEKVELCNKCYKKELKREKERGYFRNAVYSGECLAQDIYHYYVRLLSRQTLDKKILYNRKNPKLEKEKEDKTLDVPKGVNFWKI